MAKQNIQKNKLTKQNTHTTKSNTQTKQSTNKNKETITNQKVQNKRPKPKQNKRQTSI